MVPPIRISHVYRYPVKGLSPDPLHAVLLTPKEGLPHDRRFAIARAGCEFDPASPEWLPKTNFVMLMRDAALAQLKTCFDAESGVLSIMCRRDGKQLLDAEITRPEGRQRVSDFFAGMLGPSLDGPPRLVEAPGHTFTDAKWKPNATTYKYISVVNLASVRALEDVIGSPVNSLRFRANLYIDGAPAWAELDWMGGDLLIGTARLRVVSPTVRCPATQVNPETAERDLDIPALLRRNYGHVHMGVYAEVSAGGEVSRGDIVTTLVPAKAN